MVSALIAFSFRVGLARAVLEVKSVIWVEASNTLGF
jgi:hypothetical protein